VLEVNTETLKKQTQSKHFQDKAIYQIDIRLVTTQPELTKNELYNWLYIYSNGNNWSIPFHFMQ